MKWRNAGLLVVAFTAGLFAGGAVTYSLTSATPPASIVQNPQPHAPRDGAPRSEPSPPVEEAAPFLSAQLSLCTGLLEDLREECFGGALEWPNDTPTELAPAGFESQVRDAAASCPEYGLELVRSDCAEPPCIAVFRAAEGSPSMAFSDFVSDCAKWKDSYGKTVQSSSGLVDCGEGSKERYVMLAVPTEDVMGDPDEAERGDWIKRMDARFSEARVDWNCTP